MRIHLEGIGCQVLLTIKYMFFVGCYSIFSRSQSLMMQGIIPRREGVSISLYPPRDWKGKEYPRLAPSKKLLNDYKNKKLGIPDYCRIYREETLASLDPEVVVRDLQQMGSEIILLCYEPPGDFCHREIVADWLTHTLKRHVPELVRPDFVPRRIRESWIALTPKKVVKPDPDPDPPFSPGEVTPWGTVITSGSFHTTFLINDFGQKETFHNELDLGFTQSPNGAPVADSPILVNTRPHPHSGL